VDVRGFGFGFGLGFTVLFVGDAVTVVDVVGAGVLVGAAGLELTGAGVLTDVAGAGLCAGRLSPLLQPVRVSAAAASAATATAVRVKFFVMSSTVRALSARAFAADRPRAKPQEHHQLSHTGHTSRTGGPQRCPRLPVSFPEPGPAARHGAGRSADVRRTRPTRRAALTTAAVLAFVVLTGCGSTHPGRSVAPAGPASPSAAAGQTSNPADAAGTTPASARGSAAGPGDASSDGPEGEGTYVSDARAGKLGKLYIAAIRQCVQTGMCHNNGITFPPGTMIVPNLCYLALADTNPLLQALGHPDLGLINRAGNMDAFSPEPGLLHDDHSSAVTCGGGYHPRVDFFLTAVPGTLAGGQDIHAVPGTDQCVTEPHTEHQNAGIACVFGKLGGWSVVMTTSSATPIPDSVWTELADDWATLLGHT